MAALDALNDQPRWVAWRNELRGKGVTKVPFSPNGKKAGSNDPARWGTRAEAERRAKSIVNGLGGGIGIELGDLGGDVHLAGIDLDSCLSEGRTLTLWANPYLDHFPTYTEISPSQRGLKLFFYCTREDVRPFLDLIKVSPDQWGCRRSVVGANADNHGPAIEMYFALRYFAVTGERWLHSPDRITLLEQAGLDRLARLIPPARSTASDPADGGGDTSRSAIAFRKGVALRRAGKNFAEMVAALSHDPDTAEWVREKERASGGRELRRIWEKAATGKSVPELSDEDLALDFAQRQADELRYVAAWGKWLVWAEGIWRPEARSIPPWASRPEECVAKLSILGSSSSQQSRRSLAPPFRVKMARVSRPRERECKGKDNRLSVGPYKPLSRRKKWLSHSRRNGFLIVRAGRGAENIDAAQAGLMVSCEHSRSVNAAITSTMVTNLRGQDRGACVRL